MKSRGVRSSMIFAGLAACLLATSAPSGGGARAADPLPNDTALRARYALPASRFMLIDGESIHYVDEGHGPAIVMIHGSYASVRQWDVWAKKLSPRHRVIRLDFSPAGLSGPNPKGDYDSPRRIELVDRLTRNLGVDRFFVVATSSGGVVGAGYAAEHPERVIGLVLNNIAAGPLAFDPTSFSPAFRQALADDAKSSGVHSPTFWRQIFLHNFSDSRKVSPALVREWTDLNGRARFMPPAPGSTSHVDALARTPADLVRITAPTLLVWSAEDRETTAETHGSTALSLLASQDKALVIVPHCGHLMPLECPAAGLAAARPFFDRLSSPAR